MKATWKGATIAESDDTVVVEGNHYFPESSLNRAYVTFSNHRSSCPWKGQAHYYSLMVDGNLNENVAPKPTVASTLIVPPWRAMMRRTVASPMLDSCEPWPRQRKRHAEPPKESSK